MSKIVIQNEKDPCIAITLAESPIGDFYGSCTECGRPVDRPDRCWAITDAQRHVDSHEPVIIGGDRDSLVR